MTESQWKFIKLKWDAYITQSPVQDNTNLMQLQSTCNMELKQRVLNTGTYSQPDTLDKFLAKIKELLFTSQYIQEIFDKWCSSWMRQYVPSPRPRTPFENIQESFYVRTVLPDATKVINKFR